MKELDRIEADLALLEWGRRDAADPPEIVHSAVPLDFSDDKHIVRGSLTLSTRMARRREQPRDADGPKIRSSAIVRYR